jgi:hypothetical protein
MGILGITAICWYIPYSFGENYVAVMGDRVLEQW